MTDIDNDIEDLWCAALETIVHQVLYVRRIYPQESFCASSFLGLKCRANRHPEVVAYIAETTTLAVAALAAGESHEIAIVLFDQATATDLETYRLSLDETLLAPESRKKDLERDIQNMILSLHALEGLRIPRWSPETTFRIMVLLSSEVKSCTALKNALSEGKWFCPGDISRLPSRCRRPIYQMSSCGCRFYAEIEPITES